MQTLEPTSQTPTFPLTVRKQMVGFKQRLAERIIEAREAQGWDQRELAFRADVSDKTVQRLEQAKVAAPRGSTLRKIAEATGRRVEDLRPDMDTEERDLRAQLDRIEAGVTELRDLLRGGGPTDEAVLEALEAAELPRATEDEAQQAAGQPQTRNQGRKRRPA